MLVQCEFASRALGFPTTVDVFLPDGREDEKFPVLYLLHGGDGAPWIRHTGIMRYAQEAGVAVVMPFCRNYCWRKADVIFPGMEFEADKVVDFEEFMNVELPDVIARNFPVSSAREDTYIAGLSLGGYGATYYAMTRPDRFAAVGILSGYIYHPRLFFADRAAMSQQELFDNLMPELVEAVKENGARGVEFPKVFQIVGTKEVLEVPPVFNELLRENGAEVTYDCTSYPYGHEWDTWENCIRDFLKWIPRREQ